MRFIYLLFGCLFFLPFALMAQPGAFYHGFGTGGIYVGNEGVLQELAVFPNGKVVAISPKSISDDRYGLIEWSVTNEFNTDGTLAYQKQWVIGPDGTELKNLLMQPDGKHLVMVKNSRDLEIY